MIEAMLVIWPDTNFHEFSDQLISDGGTLHRDMTSIVDDNPSWDIIDIINNVKVVKTFFPFS